MQELVRRIKKSLDILRNGIPAITEPKKIVFGIMQALDAFRKTKGRYANDASKAMPFSILVTAELLGADVQIQPEGKVMLGDITLTMKQEADLLEKTKKYLERLGDQKEELESAMEFFTIG